MLPRMPIADDLVDRSISSIKAASSWRCLVICSVVSVAVIVLRALALRRDFVMPPDIEKEIEALRPEDTEGVARASRARCATTRRRSRRIISTGLHHLAWPKSENMEAVQTRARHEIVRLESGLFILEVIVGIAPLLGLLGAVSGLRHGLQPPSAPAPRRPIRTSSPTAFPRRSSTTIVGLAIAIPSLIAY